MDNQKKKKKEEEEEEENMYTEVLRQRQMRLLLYLSHI